MEMTASGGETIKGREERGDEEQREERLEASHGPRRFPGRIGRW
jgi:hypothetical protein